jgi:hypothetical protein
MNERDWLAERFEAKRPSEGGLRHDGHRHGTDSPPAHLVRAGYRGVIHNPPLETDDAYESRHRVTRPH